MDDEPFILERLEQDLSLEGFTVHTASSGEQGLKLLETLPAKLIISDQIMPGGMYGTAFLKKVRERYPDVVTMILSAFSESKYILEAMNEARIFYYLLKPWNKVELIDRVSKALQFYDSNLKNRERMERLHRLLIQSEKMATLSIYSSSLAHHIRNMILPFQAPLDVIQSDTRELKTASPETRGAVFDKYCDEIDDMVEDTKIAIANINDLIDCLLSVHRANKKESEHFDLREVIQNAIRLEKLRKELDAIEIHFEAHGKGFTIEALKGYLASNIVELIQNASDAIRQKDTAGKGSIWITLEDAKDEPWGEALKLVVKDDGCGMSDEIQKEIFAPLYTTKAKVGTGLGLTAVYEMVQLHGGFIDVKSTVGKGSVFTLILPKHQKNKIVFDISQTLPKQV